MIKTNALVSVFSILLAATAPSAFADKGKGGKHHGRDHGRNVRFVNNDRDDDRDVRRRVIVTRNDDVRRRVIVTSNTDRRVVRRASMRFRGLDTNGDGRITRREWRGNAKSFRVHDRNRDGILSGREVRAVSYRR